MLVKKTTNPLSIAIQKSSDLIYAMAEAWNIVYFKVIIFGLQ